MTIATQAAYARYRKERGLPGGTGAAVCKAVKSGRIRLTADGLVDFDAADVAWAGNTHVEQQERGRSGKKSQAAAGVKPQSGEDDSPEDYLTARARKETALADLAQMQAAELRGELARIDDVVLYWGNLVAAARARLLALPSMLAPQVASHGRIAEVEALLRKFVNEALSELAGDGVPGKTKERAEVHARDLETAA